MVERSRTHGCPCANHQYVLNGVHDNRGVQYEFGPIVESWPRGVDVLPQAFALGMGFRFGLHGNPDSKGLYILEYLFVIRSVRFTFQFAHSPFSRPCNIYCVVLRIYCCRSYPAQETCEVSVEGTSCPRGALRLRSLSNITTFLVQVRVYE